ncbi:hypothetical protein ACHGLA_35050 [Streptomyces sp. YH02]|uniref:hypothetical protein n=1 Tax=Streptomyces sp. YH02 TaxID=3256999 RepID=UPI0037576B06
MPMNVEGRWGLAQSDGLTMNLSLKQEGTSFSGEAEFDIDGGRVTESVSGKVTDSDITFKRGTLHYIGTFAQGQLYGLSIDFQDAGTQATWFTPKVFEPL